MGGGAVHFQIPQPILLSSTTQKTQNPQPKKPRTHHPPNSPKTQRAENRRGGSKFVTKIHRAKITPKTSVILTNLLSVKRQHDKKKMKSEFWNGVERKKDMHF